MSTTPDETVAESIVVAFRAKKLIPADDLTGLAPKLATGSVSVEGWRLLAEAAHDKNGGKGHDKAH